jgi:hypothetical protein
VFNRSAYRDKKVVRCLCAFFVRRNGKGSAALRQYFVVQAALKEAASTPEQVSEAAAASEEAKALLRSLHDAQAAGVYS